MRFAVLGYNFPHWKTQNGLFNLFVNGFRPEVVILQNRKVLNIPESKYRITPVGEYLQDPKAVCKMLDLRYKVLDHELIENRSVDFAVILGARILPARTINQFEKGILNIHPGILPGNRGLDNLKWSLIKGLPIGCTAHFIDRRVDMGKIVATAEIKRLPNESIRDLYNRQRNLEQRLLIETMEKFETEGIDYSRYTPVSLSEKFNPVPDQLDHYEECSYSIELSQR